jgi:hypothetical protein
VQTRNQKHEAQTNNREALQDAQRTGFQHQLVLRIQGVAHQAGTNKKPGEIENTLVRNFHFVTQI